MVPLSRLDHVSTPDPSSPVKDEETTIKCVYVCTKRMGVSRYEHILCKLIISCFYAALVNLGSGVPALYTRPALNARLCMPCTIRRAVQLTLH